MHSTTGRAPCNGALAFFPEHIRGHGLTLRFFWASLTLRLVAWYYINVSPSGSGVESYLSREAREEGR